MGNPPAEITARKAYCLFLNSLLLTVCVFVLTPLAASADEAQFVKNCGVCHTLNPDEPRRQGPDLKGIVGRKAGSVEDFPYSNSVRALDIIWDAATLDRWLTAPTSVASDTYMMFSLPDAAVRQNIIQFLSTQ